MQVFYFDKQIIYIGFNITKTYLILIGVTIFTFGSGLVNKRWLQ